MLLKFSEIENQLKNLEISTLVGLYSYQIKFSPEDKLHLASVKEFPSIICHSNVYRNNREIPLYHIDFILEDIQNLVNEILDDLIHSKEDIPLPEWVVDDNSKNYLFHLIGLTGSNISSVANNQTN